MAHFKKGCRQELSRRDIICQRVIGFLLTGHTRQGLKCRVCKMNVHLDCQEKVTTRCQMKSRLLRRQKSTSEIETRMAAMNVSGRTGDDDDGAGKPPGGRGSVASHTPPERGGGVKCTVRVGCHKKNLYINKQTTGRVKRIRNSGCIPGVNGV